MGGGLRAPSSAVSHLTHEEPLLVILSPINAVRTGSPGEAVVRNKGHQAQANHTSHPALTESAGEESVSEHVPAGPTL